ncbi:hypothetical protein BS46_gp150 [Acinetobacter phage BS46]|nr:hypothetical protein BS46_gp150 [Acinetobacter phage BS46]
MLQVISDHIMIPSSYCVVHNSEEMCVIYHAGVFYITHIELGVCMKRVGVFVYGWQVMQTWDKLYSSEDFGKNFWK